MEKRVLEKRARGRKERVVALVAETKELSGQEQAAKVLLFSVIGVICSSSCVM